MTKPVFRFPVTFEWIGGIHIIQIKTRNFVLILMGMLLIILFTCCFFFKQVLLQHNEQYETHESAI